MASADRLKIFSDRSYIPAGVKHCQLLIPFWGTTVDHNAYLEFERQGRDFLELTTLERAEFAVLPFDGCHFFSADEALRQEALLKARRFVAMAKEAGLRSIVLVNSDRADHLDLDDAIIFRTSIEGDNRQANSYALPAWHDDLVANHMGGRIYIKNKGARPSVGFCGHAATPAMRLERSWIKNIGREFLGCFGVHVPYKEGIYLRKKVMRALERSVRVETDFLIRDAFFRIDDRDESRKNKARLEYIQNINNNDYTLCIRGYGNFTFRFFETLSMGRMPLLIETHCVLPYDFLFDYKKHCLIVPESDLTHLGDDVEAHFGAIDNERYAEMQRANRELWVEWLSPEGFFKHLRKHWETPVSVQPLKISREMLLGPGRDQARISDRVLSGGRQLQE